MARTQEQRRTETRQRLLDAAFDLIAQRGIAATSVDAVAEAAERTSGAVYDHFGGKDGLVVAVLDRWKDAAGERIGAAFASTADIGERLTSLWRAVAEPEGVAGGAWVLLEHELWLHACRRSEPHPLVVERYREARAGIAVSLSRDAAGRPGDPGEADADRAALVLALLLGLEMQRRLEPGAVPDELARAGLEALLGVTGAGSQPLPSHGASASGATQG